MNKVKIYSLIFEAYVVVMWYGSGEVGGFLMKEVDL